MSASIWDWLKPRAGRPIVVGPRPQVIGPKPSLTVEAPPRFAWDEKRWERKETTDGIELHGPYRVFDRSRGQWREFRGLLAQRGSDIGTYIDDPPQEIRRHRHGGCLQLVKDSWFRLHWRRPPATLDDALLYMERMLDESFNGERR